ncbi:hypothetical protein F5Y10DRAFT_289032 [Nemania abortiva]|nr:hypothetical protein F5Y10DRAFT_289032 [Nemania abortiva]
MGNIPSTTSALPTHTTTPCTSTASESSRHFSVSPFMHSSTFVSITKASSKTSSYTSAPTIRTEEYCTWDWEGETFSCSSWALTLDTPTPLTIQTPTITLNPFSTFGPSSLTFETPTITLTPATITPTGGYETSEASFSTSLAFPYYSCTDLLCIESVLSEYGFDLCEATSTTDYGLPTVTWPWAESSTTDESPSTTTSCDLFDWEDCPETTAEPTETWPTIIWPTPTPETEQSPTETSSDCDSLVTASTSTDYCEDDIECYTSIDFTVPEAPPTPYATITRLSPSPSYSYRRSSTRRTSTSTTSECDFWDEDCIPDATGEFTTLAATPDPGRHHTASTTRPVPRQSDEVPK